MTRPTREEFSRRRAWGLVSRPVREIPMSELLGIFADLRASPRVASLAITHAEWWLFDASARLREVADEIDRRLPLGAET